MYVITVDLDVPSGAERELAELFNGPFKAAISAQEGFQSVTLLKPTEGSSYLLVITFTEQALQQRWVATDLHEQVWSPIEAVSNSCQVRSFHSL